MTTTPFTFADNVLSSREDIMDDDNQDQYVPFIINRHLSYFIDTVMYANDMNMASGLPKSAQYQYFLNTIPKRKRFSKWEKKVTDPTVEAIAKYFNCNRERAQEMFSLIPEDVKLKIVNEMGYGDDKRSTKPRRSGAKAPR